jgi:flagellar basal-body rod protein FlgB
MSALDLASSPFFGLLRARLDQLSDRQRLISENIANASTPNYTPRDLDTSGFQHMVQAASGGGGLAMTRTNPGHMTPAGSTAARVVTRADSETTIDGNAVVMEEQVTRSAETRMAFETSIALYQKGLALVRMASRPPGR